MNIDFFCNEVCDTSKELVDLQFPSDLLASVVSAAEKAGVTVGEYIAQAVKEALSA